MAERPRDLRWGPYHRAGWGYRRPLFDNQLGWRLPTGGPPGPGQTGLGIALLLLLLSPATILAWVAGQALRATGLRWWKLALAAIGSLVLVVTVEGGPGPALAHHFAGYLWLVHQLGRPVVHLPTPGAFLWPQLPLAIPVGLLAAALNLAGRRQAIDPAEVHRTQREAQRRMTTAVKHANHLRDDPDRPVALGVWFLFAGVVTVAIIVLAESWPWGLLLALPLLPSIPVAVGIAILRYRLYDIDRIISRTLSYGLLSAILGLAYAGVVLLLGQLFGGVTNQPPSWAVAGATLPVAALFQPARRRIQRAVDRRFNRRRYDAAMTIQAFSARLRDEIDLDALSAELLAVVDQTMEPTTASLWLRPTTSSPQDVSDSVAHRPAARPDPLRSGRRSSMYGNRARQHAPTMPQGGGEDTEGQGR